jgi:hypothetical protein
MLSLLQLPVTFTLKVVSLFAVAVLGVYVLWVAPAIALPLPYHW